MKSTVLLSAALVLSFAACDGTVTGGDPGDEPGEDDPIDEPVPRSPELDGAGGRDLLTDWPSIDIPYSQNAKLLNFIQLRREVLRATGREWLEGGVNQWPLHRTVLGGPDFQTSFTYDITPNQQKILTIRRMAFRVCQQVINAEATQAEREIYNVLDPAEVIDVEAAATTEQVRSLYDRFFLAEPSQVEIDDSLALLGDLQEQQNQRQAWRGLCAAYIGSMRFLSY